MIFDYQGFFGADISTYQDSAHIPGNVDFEKMREYGASFVIIKASQGDFRDFDFPVSWPNAKAILPRAPYHYWDNRYSPQVQAKTFWEVVRGDLEGICWLDLEDRTQGPYMGWRRWWDFLEEFRRLSNGAAMGIYTGYYYWRENMRGATQAQVDAFGRYPLWLAAYPPDPLHPNYEDIKCPAPWLTPLILQTGTPAIGRRMGVESEEIDLDHFNGDKARFNLIFSRDVDTLTGGNMNQGKAGANGAKVWRTYQGGILSNQIDTLPAGAIVRGGVPSGGVVAITYPLTGFTKFSMLVEYVPIINPPPDPVPDPPPPSTEYILHVKDGVTRKFVLTNE